MRHYTPTHLLALLLTLIGLAGAVGTPAGTVIENQAQFQALPDDSADGPISVYSPTATTTVEQVCSLSVLPNGTVEAPGQTYAVLPAETATLAYTLTNSGNALNTFALSASPDASSTFTPGDLSIHLDQNGNGVIDDGEPAISSLSLPADGSAPLLVRVGTDAGSRGQAYVNLVAACAAALGAATDSDNVARVTVAEPPALDLTKSFSAARVAPGAPVGVTLNLKNGGQGDSREVLVSDLLNTPGMTGFSYVAGSAAPSLGAVEYSADGVNWQAAEPAVVVGLRWRLSSLKVGETASLTFQLRAPATEVGTRQNVATFTSPGVPDGQATATIEVKYLPAIALGPLGNPRALPGGELSSDDLQVKDTAFSGQEVCFKHTEQNLGDRDDNLSVRAEVTVWKGAVRLLELDGSPLLQGLTLAPNAAHDFQMCFTPTGFGPLSATAQNIQAQAVRSQAIKSQAVQTAEVLLTVSGIRGAPENKTIDRIGNLIIGQPALIKSVSPSGTVRQGDTLTYTLTVSNPLSADLTGVVLRDPLDAHLEFVSAEGGTLADGVVTWNIGTLAAGETITRTLVARVLASTPDDTVIDNSFTFTSAELPTPITSAPVSTPVFAGGLVFSKTSSPAEVTIGDTVTYTFLARNPSAVATLRTVIITDTMPVGLEYIPGSSRLNGTPIADPVVTGNDYVWTLPELGPGAQHEVTFEARVLPSAVGDRIQNTAIARAISSNGSEVAPVSGSATNRITPLLFAPNADIVGYVFEDIGRDGRFDAGIDMPVQNARVILANGRIALTDATGRYHFGTVREGFAGLRLDLASVAQMPLSVPQDGGRPGSRGVYVRNLTSIDFPLEPNAGDIDVIRDTTLEMGPAQTPGLLQVRKVVMTTTEEGVYRVQLTLKAGAALSSFTLQDPLPDGATLLDGENTLALESLPDTERVLTYRFRFAGAPRAAVTDPVAGWRY